MGVPADEALAFTPCTTPSRAVIADRRVDLVADGLQRLPDRLAQALTRARIPGQRIYLDKKSGATTDRPGLHTVLEYARHGDVIVVHTLDRLGRTGARHPEPDP